MSVNEKMKAIADAIREKTNITEPLTLDDMAREIPNVYQYGYDSGKVIGRYEGLEEGYGRGLEEGLEYTTNGLREVIKIQETYLAEPMSFYIMSMVTYEAEKIECMTSDTWEDIVTNDYNGIISQDGIYIDENGYVKNLHGSYLCGDDGSYCKSYDSPRPNMSYWATAEEPIEQGGE